MSDIVYCPPNVDCPSYARLTAEVERLRAAGQALIDFHNGPTAQKRPDIFQLLIGRLDAALAQETTNERS
jgi:hypothetical protein